MMGPCQELKSIPYAPCQLQDGCRVSTSSSGARVPRETLIFSLTHEAGPALSQRPAPAAHHPDRRHAVGTSCLCCVPQVFKPLCSLYLKAQEEQAFSSKGSKLKTKEKSEQVRETQREKRRANYTRKGLTGGPSGTTVSMSDVDQNNFDGEHTPEKFSR